ncbi:MAG: hypothetical protein WAM28_06860 [Chlamydiales bacterium]
MKKIQWILILLLAITSGCKNNSKKIRGEYIFRNHNEHLFAIPSADRKFREKYPWEDKYIAGLPRITKEFFRCKGSPHNPIVERTREGKRSLYYRDCQGGGGHGLPLKDGKEFIYPCLIDLLNYIQEKTEKQAMITTGHRCPQHNAYADPSPYNWGSKHMLGAEVDFYVKEMEEEPETIVELIKAYYQERYLEDSAYRTFLRYEKGKLNVSTLPWYNKEIFIKIYLPEEGRDFDNQHPFPYLGVQVRYDSELKKRVVFDQEVAQNYLRH